MSKKISKKELCNFGYLISFGLPLILGWIIPLINGHSFMVWTIWVALPTLIIVVISPKILIIPYRAWMKLGNLLGLINSHIILGVVFITVLLPIAFVMKTLGYDPLRSKKTNLLSFKENKSDSKLYLTRIF